MSRSEPANAIPKETALQLYAEIRQGARGKWYTFAGLQCWCCATFSKGDPAKMCVSNRPDFGGCALVNARYDRQLANS
ncbi:MAG: hypothetical protein KJZ93_06945 [Caldilineaceae bacterium]|nr:hypothetical protein [Caldilineaceae bacterium]